MNGEYSYFNLKIIKIWKLLPMMDNLSNKLGIE